MFAEQRQRRARQTVTDQSARSLEGDNMEGGPHNSGASGDSTLDGWFSGFRRIPYNAA
jgi:hypothetical protein